MAKLDIKFNNSGKIYSFDTETAKKKPVSVQEEMRNSDPRPNDPVTQMLISDLSKQTRTSRIADTVSGALKSTAGGLMDMTGVLYQSGQNARSAGNQQTLNEYKTALYRAQRELSDMQTENARSPGAWGEVDLQAQRNILADARRKYDAMNRVVQGGVQQKATDAARDFAGDVTASGMQDVERAKNGMGKLGKLAVDVGVAGAQMAADVGMAALTGGSALIPMAARAFGGSTQDARQSGASFGQQAAYGLSNAALQVGTEKMFNVAAPFKKMFGAGVLDKALEKATAKLTGSAAGRVALSTLSEASEETVAGILDPLLRAATLGETPEWDAGQILQESLVGGILGLAGSGVEIATQKRGNAAQEAAGTAQSTPAGNFTAAPNDAVTQLFVDALAGKKAASTGTESAKTNYDTSEATAIRHEGKSFRNLVAGFDTSVSEFFNKWRNGRKSHQGEKLEKLYLGKLSEGSRSQVANILGYSVGERNVIVTSDDVKHIFDHHGSAELEAKRGNLPIEQWAIDALPEVISAPDSIIPGEIKKSGKNPGKQGVIFSKALQNGRVITVQFDNSSRRTMEITTMYVKENSGNPTQALNVENQSPQLTSETPPDPVVSATNSIPSSNANVKNDILLDIFTGKKRLENGEFVEAPQPMGDASWADGSLGSAQAGFDPYSQLQNQTDAANFHDDGANAARVVDVPKTNFEGRNVPESAKTVMGAQAIDGADVRMIESQIANGTLAFDTITDEKAVAKAQNAIREKTFDGALEQYRASVESNVASKDNTTLGQQLLILAMRSGNTANVSELLSLYTRNSTTAAQAMQAQAIFRKLSPEGQLVSIQKAVDSFNQKHDTTIEIDPEDVEAFVDAEDDAARDGAAESIFKHVAEQVPGTFTAKFDAIRYLAMLGNPRTHIRNILGNTLFQVPVAAKNRVGGVADAIASAVSGGKYERTKSISGVSPASQLAKESRADWANAKAFLSHGGKFVEGQTSLYNIESEQKAFKDKGLGGAINKASEINSALLEAEDTIAKKFIYTQSLAGYLKANGVQSLSSADPGLLNRARSYAAQEALRNTFNDTNALSEAVSSLNGLRSSNNKFKRAAGYVVEGVLPFKKTPANILMRGVEYSPVGAVMGAIDTIRGAKSGDTTKLTQGIDRIASGMTGSVLMAAGMLASGAGWVTGGGDEDKNQRDFDKLLGYQSYALNLKNGKSITLDWLAPAAVPFFMGAQLQSAMEDGGLSLDDTASVIKSISDPMLEMTTLQGLNEVVESAAYAKQRGENVLAAIITAALTSYVTQVFPTALGQIERAGDKVRETTYVDKNSKVPTDLQYLFGKVANKIPGVDYNQIPYIDAWGREDGQGSAAARTANNVFNPAFVSDVKVRPVERELQRIADKTGRTSVFPQRAETKVNYSVDQGGDKVPKEKNLSSGEYLKYAVALGKEKYNLLNAATSAEYYKSMTDDEKADYVAKLYQYAKAQAVKTVTTGSVNDTWIDNAQSAKRDLGVSAPEYIALHEKYGVALVGSSYEKVKIAVKAGISIENYMSIRGALDGNDNGSISQAEARSALEASGLSREQKDAVWKLINSSWKKNPYQ